MLRQEMDLGGATQDSHMRMPINLSYGAIHESSTKFKMHLGAAGVGAPVAVGASGGQAITKLQASSSAPGVPAAGGQMQTTAPTAPPPPAAAHLISHATHLNHEEECNVQGPMARSSIIINNNNSSSSCSQDGVSAPVAAEAFATSEPKSRKLAAVKYRECLKNHAANIGGHALDGCGEFMASGEEGSLEALMCAACGCHRNFHRREAEGEEADDQAACGFCTTTSSGKHLRGLVHDPRTRQLLAPAQLAALPPPLPPPPATAAASPLGALPPGNAAGRLPPHASHYQYNQQAQLQHPMVGLANSNPGAPPNSSDCDDPMVMQQQLGHRHFQYPGHHAMQHVPAHTSPNANVVGPSPNYSSYAPPHHPPPFDRHPYHNHHYSLLNSNSSHHHMMMKKRFRTKFTAEQKDRMLAFAEKLGWRIQKQDEAAVQQFCGDVGVRRHVLKVWMHNNKNTMGKKISPNEMPVGYLDSGSASPTNSGSGVH